MKITEMFDKKYLRRVLFIVLGALLAVALLIYIGSHFFRRFSDGLELVDARLTTVSETVETDGYIMRAETPVYSSVSGKSVIPKVQSGEHVHAGELIAEVYSESHPDIEERIEEIEKQIALFEKAKESDNSFKSTAGIETSIYDTVAAIRKSADSGNYSDTVSLRTTLLLGIKNHNIITGKTKDCDKEIAELTKDKDELASKLGKRLEEVYSAGTGYFFAGYDGYGKIFSSDKKDTVTYSEFERMTESSPDSLTGIIGVTVTDYNWYLACLMTKEEAAALDSLGKCSVFFPYSGYEMTMNVDRVTAESGGDGALVFLRSGRIPSGFDFTRMQPVTITSRSYTGFRIPKSAVRVVDGYEGVYIMDEVTIAFRRINIIHDNGTDVICTGEGGDEILITNENQSDLVSGGEEKTYGFIRQNDIVVVGGVDLYDGKVIS